MSSLADLIGQPIGGPKPGYVWRNGQWVPFHVASPGGPGDAAHDSWTRNEERRMNYQHTERQRMRTPINSGGNNPYGLPDQMPQSTQMGVDQIIRSSFGYLAGFVNHPEIGPILRRAAREGWDEATLYGAVSGTQWWQNTSAAQRTWWQLTNEDPAEARRLVAQTAATIQNRARSMGLNVNVSGLAAAATANGWTDAQTVDAILQQVNWATIEAGDLTALRDNVKSVASDYLVGASDATAQSYATAIASGEMSMEGVRSAMQAQAKQRFSWMADQLDAGMTVKDYFRPTRDVIAQELGVAAEEIDLTDSKWLKLVEVRDRDSGELRGATLDEAMLAARKDPMFANTQKAKEMTTKMSDMIGKMFGRI